MQQLITQSAPGTAQQTQSACGGELAGTDECWDIHDIAALAGENGDFTNVYWGGIHLTGVLLLRLRGREESGVSAELKRHLHFCFNLRGCKPHRFIRSLY